jgi:hypothetical protein
MKPHRPDKSPRRTSMARFRRNLALLTAEGSKGERQVFRLVSSQTLVPLALMVGGVASVGVWRLVHGQGATWFQLAAMGVSVAVAIRGWWRGVAVASGTRDENRIALIPRRHGDTHG